MNAKDVIEKALADNTLSDEFAIRSSAVFGSVARGEAGPESDVDILVEFAPDARIGLFAFARLQRRLSEILGPSVDVATPGLCLF
jgi:hypothetical protein